MRELTYTIFIYALFVATTPLSAQYISNDLNPERTLQSSFLVSGETSPQAIAFNADGTRMFITGTRVEEVWEYNLTIAYDVSTASYFGKFEVDVDPLIQDPQALLFQPDGSSLLVAGSGGDGIYQFVLTDPFDIVKDGSEPSRVQETIHLDIIYTIQDLAWNGNGTELFVLLSSKIMTYNLSEAYDLSTATYAGSALDFEFSAVEPFETSARGFTFNEGGENLFITGGALDRIIRYNLAGSHNVHRATYAGSENDFDVDGLLTTPGDVELIVNDNRLMVIDATSNTIYSYAYLNNLNYQENSTDDVIDIQAQTNPGFPDDVPYDANVTYSLVGGDAALFSIDMEGIIRFINPPDFEQPQDLYFDNTYVFTMEVTNDFDGRKDTRIFSLNIENVDDSPYFGPFEGGFELSTATYDGIASSFYVGDILGNARDLVFSEAGRKLYVLDNVADSIYQFNLATPYQLPTANYSGKRLFIGDALTEPSGFTLTPDGSKLIISGESAVDKKIYEYQLSTFHDISTAIYSGEGESLDASGSSFSGGGIGTIRFSEDGMTLYVMRLAFLLIEEYHLTTPYDISTGVESNIWIQGTEFDFDPKDVAFSDDGLLFWKLADDHSWMIRYELTAPFDLSTLDYVGPSSSSNNDQLISFTDPEANPITFAFNNGGTKFFVLGTTDDRIYEYHLPATLKVGENESFVFDVDAWNGFGGNVDEGVTYSLAGTDAANFVVSTSGEISFIVNPDFENPVDANGDNAYEVTVQVDNGINTESQELIISVKDKTDEIPPTITSPAMVTFEENATGFAYFATANEVVTFTLGDEKDEQLFSTGDGEFVFINPPDFENPLDANGDNIYLIDVIADDGENTTVLEVAITIIDMGEAFVEACDSYDWEGSTYTNSGTYQQTLTSSIGLDSLATLYLTILESTSGSEAVSACDSYEWEGAAYTSSGDYTITLINSVGCDSLATLNLTILESTSGSEAVSACESYDWEGTTYTSSGDYTITLTNSVGCDSLATLNLTILESTSSTTEISACETYEWNGTTYSNSGTYSEMFTNAVGCDSTATLVLEILEPTSGSEAVTACDSYDWEGMTYTSSGDYMVTLTNSVGCDSLATLNLTILESTSGSEAVSACDSYEWEGAAYTSSGDYTITLINSVGCDSLATLNLTILESTSGSEAVSACESYDWEGTTYTSSGDYTITLTNSVGCDSLATLNLTILESTSSTTEISACETYEWNGTTYSNSGTYSEMFTNAVGCDSTATLVLEILEPTSGSEAVTACDSYDWEGMTYTSSGDYMVTLTNSVGCDSLATLNLTILESTSGSEAVSACDSYEWEGAAYTSSGDYTITLTNSVGCDSLATLNLTILESTSGSEAVSACESYDWEGTTYTFSGDYTITLTNSVGCDSLATLNLTILESTSSTTEISACETYEWNGTTYTNSGTYSEMFTNAVGCDSTATLVLEILELTSDSEAVTACDSYDWEGMTYTSSGDYIVTLTNSVGCDSLATLNLTILESTSGSEAVSACDSYEWEGATYTSSGDYTITLTNSVGCDSLATLNLTILESTSGSEAVSACDSYDWEGTTYTSSGDYTITLTNSVGCDSLATLNLTILESTSSTAEISACETYEWNGTTYTNSGTYSEMFTNAVGCDSTATLVLEILEPTSGSEAVTACDSYDWEGMTYTSSGDYMVTLTNSVGCDSLATLNLTILESTSGTEAVSACDSYDWEGATYTSSGDYTITLTNSVGCDSLATLNLTILESTSGSEAVSACDSYDWNGTTYTNSGTYSEMFTNAVGCDSTATLVLEILEPSFSTSDISTCGSYEWNGELLTSSGTYTEMFTNSSGCDSTATLILEVVEEPEIEIILEEGVLSVQNANDLMSFQWINCETQEVVSNANLSQFEVTQDGQYAVEVDVGGCVVVSECIVVELDQTVLELPGEMEEISVYPNPTTGPVLINLDPNMKVRVKILTLSGQVLDESTYKGMSLIETNIEQPGLYLISIENIDSKELSYFKVLKL